MNLPVRPVREESVIFRGVWNFVFTSFPDEWWVGGWYGVDLCWRRRGIMNTAGVGGEGDSVVEHGSI